jgi:hypothetical protein
LQVEKQPEVSEENGSVDSPKVVKQTDQIEVDVQNEPVSHLPEESKTELEVESPTNVQTVIEQSKQDAGENIGDQIQADQPKIEESSAEQPEPMQELVEVSETIEPISESPIDQVVENTVSQVESVQVDSTNETNEDQLNDVNPESCSQASEQVQEPVESSINVEALATESPVQEATATEVETAQSNCSNEQNKCQADESQAVEEQSPEKAAEQVQESVESTTNVEVATESLVQETTGNEVEEKSSEKTKQVQEPLEPLADQVFIDFETETESNVEASALENCEVAKETENQTVDTTNEQNVDSNIEVQQQEQSNEKDDQVPEKVIENLPHDQQEESQPIGVVSTPSTRKKRVYTKKGSKKIEEVTNTPAAETRKPLEPINKQIESPEFDLIECSSVECQTMSGPIEAVAESNENTIPVVDASAVSVKGRKKREKKVVEAVVENVVEERVLTRAQRAKLNQKA